VPFSNPIVAGVALIREAIQSPNYVAGTSGWTINQDGTAEFSDTVVRGDFEAGTSPFRVVIDDTGMYIYGDGGGGVEVLGVEILTTTQQSRTGVVDALHVATTELIMPAYLDSTSTQGYLFADTVGGQVKWLLPNVGLPSDGLLFYKTNTSTRANVKNGGNGMLDSGHIQVYSVAATAALTLTAVFQDIAGVTQTFTTINPNAKIVVTSNIDFQTTVAVGAGQLLGGQLVVDGSVQAGQVIQDASFATDRNTPGQNWSAVLAAAGSHTVKMQARKTAAAGAATANNIHSRMTITVFDLP
jgi:hypothetical protein